MIHVFHGFLGSPADFNFLVGHNNIKLHDLYANSQIHLEEEDILIGYSMGGRYALELAAKADFKIKKLILINAHPGLPTENARIARREWEELIGQKLLEQDFLSYWNALPIFKHDNPLHKLSEERIQASLSIFKKFRLSDQQNYLPEIIKHKSKVLCIIGQKDEKYQTLADTELLPKGIPCKFIDAGHRLFQHPEKIMQVLNEQGVL